MASISPEEYMYQMEKLNQQRKREEMKMRAMQGMAPYPWDGTEQKQAKEPEPERPKKAKHLNPKLLITKGSK